MMGLVLLALLVPAATVASPLVFSAGTALVLVIVAVWETWSFRPARAGAPS